MKFDGIVIAVAIGLLVLLGALLAEFYDSLGTYAEVVSIARDIIVAVVAVIGAILGILGLGEWQRQFNAKIEHELAWRIIRVVYQLQNAIGSFRFPFMPGGEMHAAFMEAQKKGEIHGEFDEFIAALDVRFTKLQGAVLALQGEHKEADVLWGREGNTKLITELLHLVHTLSVDYSSYKNYYYKKKTRMSPAGLSFQNPRQEYYEKEFEKHEKTVQGMDDDDFGKKVAKAVADIEGWLRPKLIRPKLKP